jgi:hypothetical protein
VEKCKNIQPFFVYVGLLTTKNVACSFCLQVKIKENVLMILPSDAYEKTRTITFANVPNWTGRLIYKANVRVMT